ncbi:DUF2794 domain-containing protein [Pikeienuella sp. HZG-20]|uniref:DUF2794 domain-containing protein n=1 Tax=Paludibacillus litoralis TaxID=3133267 RepID=UPI0030EF0B76
MSVISSTAFGRTGGRRAPEERVVAFHRTELSIILAVYGRMVAAAEWRDYSIDFLPERAVFSVFRRATEYPLYRIEKLPRLAARQGMYVLFGRDGRVLKRGSDLKQVMRFFESKKLKLVE